MRVSRICRGIEIAMNPMDDSRPNLNASIAAVLSAPRHTSSLHRAEFENSDYKEHCFFRY